MAKMNIFLHDMEAEIRLGDTMKRPAFTGRDGSLRKFDLVTANPMWNQKFQQEIYENDPYNRFLYGIPPSSSADWGWIQHMFASLKKKGKMAVVLDTGAVSRGSGNEGRSRERDIRKISVEKDWIEAVILMPDNLFYNTPSAGLIIVINRNKAHRDEILLINASELYKKGRPKNYLDDKSIERISDIYLNWKEEEGVSKIISKDEAVKNDYNLSPSRYVSAAEEENILELEEAGALLKEAEDERKRADEKMLNILESLGLIE